MTIQTELTMRMDDIHAPYPFVEDEDCNITGYGHQDPQQFAAEVARYDREIGGMPDDEIEDWSSYIIHTHARIHPDDPDRLQACKSTDDGAFPITTLWGQR